MYTITYHIVQNFDGGIIDGLTSITSLTKKTLMDIFLGNLYLLYS